VVQAFTTGTVVQVFLLAGSVPTETWSGNGPGDPSRDCLPPEPPPGVPKRHGILVVDGEAGKKAPPPSSRKPRR
jgi:hypothetical protein